MLATFGLDQGAPSPTYPISISATVNNTEVNLTGRHCRGCDQEINATVQASGIFPCCLQVAHASCYKNERKFHVVGCVVGDKLPAEEDDAKAADGDVDEKEPLADDRKGTSAAANPPKADAMPSDSSKASCCTNKIVLIVVIGIIVGVAMSYFKNASPN